jgi:RNA polymerase sigma factor (sigma-70 family)
MLLSSQSDERLVSLAHAGDERAFAAIVERYRRELLAHASRMRSDGRADDVVQQTFLSAYAALRSGTEVTHLRGWLYRILRNEVIRTSSRSILEVELDPASIASEPLEEASQRRMLAFEALSSIAALPTRQRHAIVATALDGESRAAVAVSMGVSEGAVRQLMHRARATLRAGVAAFTPGPLANWLASVRGAAGNQAPEILIGAGATSGAGVAVKLGAILATGALASGIVGSQLVSPSGHPGTRGSQSNRRVAVRNVAVVGTAGAAKGTGGVDVRATSARPRPGSVGGGLPRPAGSRIAASGRGTTSTGGHDRAPVPERRGASRGLAGTRVTTSPSRGGGGSGDDHRGVVGESPLAGGTTEHGGGGSTGGDGSGSGGSVVDGGSGSTSGRDGGSGDSAGASTVGVAPASGDGGHDGGSSDTGTVSATGSSDGGRSTAGGSSDGGSIGGRSSDGGSGDSGASGSSSSGR